MAAFAAALTLGPRPVAAQKVPAVAAGPALYEGAAQVEAPVSAVVVYSDRARITRRGRAELRSGVRAIRIDDLPGAALLDTLRVSAKGAEVLRVEASPVERERIGLAVLEGLVESIEEDKAALSRLAARRAVLTNERALLNQFTPLSLPADATGKAVPAVDPNGWSTLRRFTAERRASLTEAVTAIDAEARGITKALQPKLRELGEYQGVAFDTVRRVEVRAVLRVSSARPEIVVDYFVKGAEWRPAYTVELNGKGTEVTLRTAGRVKQTTGEDWLDAELALSTAVPGRGITAPRLDTWTLGESRDFTPKPRAARDPMGSPLPPVPTPPIAADAARAARVDDLRNRLALAAQWPAFTGEEGGVGDLGVRGVGSGGGGRAAGRSKARKKVRRRPKPTMAPPPPPAAAPEPTREALSDSDDELSFLAARREVAVVQKRSAGRSAAGSGAPVQRTPLDLFERAAATRPQFGDRSLPAMLAGGLDYVYRAATRASVPSSRETHVVPLSATTYPVSTRYAAAPGLRPTAYLTATVRNTRETPILAGPVDIFAGADYVGTGQLETTGEGGELTLPLGADEDIRIERRVIAKTVTEGTFSKEDITRYTTELDVANDKRRAITIQITEQFPIGGVTDDVEVARGKAEPSPAEGPDESGRMRFDLEIPAGQVRTIKFSYTIRRPADWRLYQR